MLPALICHQESLVDSMVGLLKNNGNLLFLLVYWRRGWDSNPRYGRTVHLISNQALSTTQTPLLILCCYVGVLILTPESAKADDSAMPFTYLPTELFTLSYCSRRSNSISHFLWSALSLKLGQNCCSLALPRVAILLTLQYFVKCTTRAL